MTTIINILTDRYADWECALTMAVARGFYGLNVVTASPGGLSVTSSGGLNVQPDLAIETLKPGQFDLLILNGGGIWETEEAPDLAKLLRTSRAAGKPIAAICAATMQLAKSGLLNGVQHTSNSADFLADVPGYKGAAHYRDVPFAVRDAGIITAAGVSPVSFMKEIMTQLGKADADLRFYTGLHAAEHQSAA